MQAPRPGPGATARRLLAVFVLLGVLALSGIAAVAYYARVVIPTSYARVWKTERLSRQVNSLMQRADEIGVVLAHNVPAPATLSEEEAQRIERHQQLIRTTLARLRREADDEDLAHIEAVAPFLREFLDSATASVDAAREQDARRFERLVEAEALPKLTTLVSRGDTLTSIYAERSMQLLLQVNQKIDALGLATLIYGVVFLAILLGGSVASLRLLTARDRAIEEHLDRLERVNSDLEAFAGRVAHDLRGPLMPIMLAASALKERPGDSKLVLSVAARVERATNRAVRLIDGLLAFSRAAEPSSETCNGKAVVEDALDELRETLKRNDVRLEMDAQPTELAIGATLFQQIVQNLLENAIRFAGDRQPPLVRVELRPGAGAAELCVSDNGPGIPRSERDRVFEPFYRLEYREGGTGLGLATVRRVVEAHGGNVRIDERPGGGAAVRVHLPCAPGETQCAASDRSAATG